MIFILCLAALLLASIAPIFLPKKNTVFITATQGVMIAIAMIYAYCQPQSIEHTWQLLVFDHIALTLSIQWDMLAKIMMIFILVIGFLIYHYAQNYLESDPTRVRFLSQFNLVLCSVLLLVMSANLLTAFVAWQFIGINLYLLLNHYHYDPAANRAAKKKFVINRIGDSSFLIAIILAYHSGSAMSFSSIHSSPHAELICGLLFISVMTKCAQFPFHIWLIDTMETPTPVSALMHAGVINAGGVLLIRVSATLTTFHALTYLILLVGLISAMCSIQWMNKQPDTKKKLAYSTMGQMGYMLTQCSLGAFPAAIFHLMSHGFYKASLFLNAGETLADKSENGSQIAGYHTIFKSCAIALMIFFVNVFIFKGQHKHIPPLMYGFILLTLITLILKINLHIRPHLPTRLMYYAVVSTLFSTYLYSFYLFSRLLPQYEYTGTISLTVQILLVMSLFFFQVSLWRKNPTWQSLAFKDRTEDFLRHFLLNPLRSAGNIINTRRYRNSTIIFYIVVMALTVISFFYGLTQEEAVLSHHVDISQWLVFSFLLAGIVSLIAANRCLSIRALIAYLILFELAFTNLAWFDGGGQVVKIGFFHLINISGILLMLGLLAKNTVSNRLPLRRDMKRLPSRVFYLTSGLLLLIGIPGTACFITEFYLLNTLVNNHLIFVLMYISLIILTAIVVMHSLQLYVFNKNYVDFLSSPISKKNHCIFLLVIGLNILSGVCPGLLLNHL